MNKKMLEYFLEKSLSGEGFLDFHLVSYGLSAKKIENNKALFDVRDEIFALRINEDCLLNFLRSCCCKCNLKDAGDATCGNGEYVANKHGYCSDFARK